VGNLSQTGEILTMTITKSGNSLAHELVITSLYQLLDNVSLFLDDFDDAGDDLADAGSGGDVCTCYEHHAELLVDDAHALAYQAQHFLSVFEGSAFSFPAMRERHGTNAAAAVDDDAGEDPQPYIVALTQTGLTTDELANLRWVDVVRGPVRDPGAKGGRQ
jgi:hypothetical protein